MMPPCNGSRPFAVVFWYACVLIEKAKCLDFCAGYQSKPQHPSSFSWVDSWFPAVVQMFYNMCCCIYTEAVTALN